jgi:hypothetical protein
MAATETALEVTTDRLGAAARVLRGSIIAAPVVVVLATVHFALSTAHDMNEPDIGNPWDLSVWEWAVLSLPVLLPMAAAVWLMVVGGKRLAGLRAGEESARQGVHLLSYPAAAGAGLNAAGLFFWFGTADAGYAPRTHELGLVFADLFNGSLNAVGWTGVAAVVGLVALCVGAIVIGVLTRKVRD